MRDWKTYYETIKEDYRRKRRERYHENLEASRARVKASADKRKDKKAEYSREYQKRNRERKAAVRKAWRHNNPEANLMCNIRRRMSRVLADVSGRIGSSELTGCTGPELRAYLEERFKPGMSWDNYGKEWHVDHRKPICSFDISDEVQVRECFHYTNLQPLWAKDNLSKGSRALCEDL